MKICISGPACGGKTFFVNSLKHVRVVTYEETARATYRQDPTIVERPMIFRLAIWQRQLDREQDIKNTKKIAFVFDRGIIDNLAFLRIYGEEKIYKSRLQETKSMLENGIITPYDVIFYFDIEYAITELLQSALNDTLRTLTINVNYFEHHLKEFKDAFKSAAKDLNMKDKIIFLKHRPEAKEYNERNKTVAEKIYSMIEIP